ncbi:MAG: PilN domain-containing protein [Paraclostridium sp.]
MSKLYISYYGNFVSIVEGEYIKKKQKYDIKSTYFLAQAELEDIDYSDRYQVLKEALSRFKYKSKDVVLCLNTRDVIVKSNSIPKLSPKELSKMMDMEIDELMSLERDDYVFSYEVKREFEESGTEYLDLILAGIRKEEVETIIDIFKEYKLNLNSIDTLPTSYLRILKKVDYEDMMIINLGEYGSIVDIYKDDSLFIHDNIPIKIDMEYGYSQSVSLAEEAMGLMNYYSSRNFGKNVDHILLIGAYSNNADLISVFKERFRSDVVQGIEKFIDLDIDFSDTESLHLINKMSLNITNLIVDNLGCMLRGVEKSKYPSMNLVTKELRDKQNRLEKLKTVGFFIPAVAIIALSPYLILSGMDVLKQKELKIVQSKIDEIKLEYKAIEDIENEIAKIKEEISIYDMLSSKQPTWGNVLADIDKKIPYKVDLKSLSLSYDSSFMVENKEDSSTEQSNQDNSENQEANNENQNNEQTEQPIYEQIPNVINIDAVAATPTDAGQFAYNLKNLGYFEKVELLNVNEMEEDNKKVYSFKITAVLKEGVVTKNE